jgi:hypothetical protein
MLSMHSVFPRMVITVAVLAGSVACDDDSVGPAPITDESILGTYSATRLDVTVAGTTTDLLDEGAEVTIMLAEEGTTTGQLFIPEGNDDGSDLDESLDGMFEFDDDNDEVRFDLGADTFLEEVTFAASREGGRIRLTGSRTFFGTRVDLVLTKQ